MAKNDKDDVQKVEVVDTAPESATEHETQDEAVEERGPRYNDRGYEDAQDSNNPLGFTIRGGRVIRRGADRAATPEEVRLWEALTGDEDVDVEESTPDLSDVDFASDEAAELAIAEGLSNETFAGEEPTGKTGFTVGDVAEIAGRTQSSNQTEEVKS